MDADHGLDKRSASVVSHRSLPDGCWFLQDSGDNTWTGLLGTYTLFVSVARAGHISAPAEHSAHVAHLPPASRRAVGGCLRPLDRQRVLSVRHKPVSLFRPYAF